MVTRIVLTEGKSYSLSFKVGSYRVNALHCNSKLQPQRFLIYLFLQTLYMFQAVHPHIIRNS